jgi:Zn-dependent peptidase ImmA (M78 family)
MINGVVGGNTRRKLDPKEFRGFSIADAIAPLVFVNGADGTESKAPQVFTLIHELAHIWAGDSGISSADIEARQGEQAELWANQVAAEVLVPADDLRKAWRGADLDELSRLRRTFSVSTLVILNRAFNAGLLEWSDYQQRYGAEMERIGAQTQDGGAGGGNFYKVQPYKVSRKLVRGRGG